jgi:hypothetical protein
MRRRVVDNLCCMQRNKLLQDALDTLQQSTKGEVMAIKDAVASLLAARGHGKEMQPADPALVTIQVNLSKLHASIEQLWQRCTAGASGGATLEVEKANEFLEAQLRNQA